MHLDDVRKDAANAVEMVDVLLGSGDRGYLDPVTSFAAKHDGAGYSREITFYVPEGTIKDAMRIRGASHLFDDLHKVARRLEADASVGFEWSIENGKAAIEDGMFTGFYLGDEESMQLVVHVRERERGLAMPEIEKPGIGYSGIAGAILTGNGIVQHATRSISAMARDPDYLAAAYMAIASGDADRPLVPLAKSSPMTERRNGMAGAEITSSQGQAMFLATEPSQREVMAAVMAQCYGIKGHEFEQVSAKVERFADEKMEHLRHEKSMSRAPGMSM